MQKDPKLELKYPSISFEEQLEIIDQKIEEIEAYPEHRAWQALNEYDLLRVLYLIQALLATVIKERDEEIKKKVASQ